MTSEEFAKSITEHTSLWVHLAGAEVGNTIHLAKDYLALWGAHSKCAERAVFLRAMLAIPIDESVESGARSMVIELRSLREEVKKRGEGWDHWWETYNKQYKELCDLREEVKRLRPVEWEE